MQNLANVVHVNWLRYGIHFFRSCQEDCVESMEGVSRSYRNLQVLIFMSVYIMHDIVFTFRLFQF